MSFYYVEHAQLRLEKRKNQKVKLFKFILFSFFDENVSLTTWLRQKIY